jgi:predicted nuclease with TOPRIM domain
MSKNAEIIAEIISEEVAKLDKLIVKQSEMVEEFSNSIERAQRISIKTDRLEEIIEHWNNLFTKQKQQINELQFKQLTENRIHRIITYILLGMIILTLTLNFLKNGN